MKKVVLMILCVLTTLFMCVGCSILKDPSQSQTPNQPSNGYTVIYQAGEGSGRAHMVSVENGEHVLLDYAEIDFEAPADKQFDYWQIGNPKTAEKQAGEKINVTADVTIVAVWKAIPKEYTITYQPGEGGGAINSINVFDGDYTLLDYEEAGFTAPENKEFVCWQIGVPKIEEKQAGDVIEVSSDLVIVAIWSVKTDAKMNLAVGKTIDLGSLYTDETMGKDVEWTIVSGAEFVDLAVGGDNLQAIEEGTAILQATAGQETYSVKVTCEVADEVEQVVDFVVEVEDGRDVKVLQITDTQLVDSTQASFSGLNDLYKPENFEENCFKYIREAVERTEPDLIIMTGDNVWGTFDDNGSALTALINVLDSFDIPWAAVYGNHDNESEKGAIWQNQQYQFSENGLFLRGVTDGNGNYTIGIKQGGEVKRVFFMMDTNLCSGAHNPATNYVTTTMGFTNDQVDWFKRTSGAILDADETVKVSMGYHVPNYAFTLAAKQYDEYLTDTYYYTLGLDVPAKDGDFGTNLAMGNNNAGSVIDYANDAVKTYGGETLVEIYKNANVDSVFVGHQHEKSLSIVYEGIRWTYGLKTGIYDMTNRENMGGTLITIDDESNALSVKHVYYDEDYQAYKDNLPENFSVAGAVVGGKDGKITPTLAARTSATKEYIAGYGAYRIDSTIQGEFNIDKSLIAGKKCVTFSFYVPSTSTARLGWPISAFSIMQTSESKSHYQPYSANGVETSSNERNVYYNYDEWTTVTVDLKVEGEYCHNRFSWIIAPGNAIYVKDISFTDLDPKSEAAVNVTVNKDGAVDTDDTIKNQITAFINEMYYVAGDVIDVKAFAKEITPKGFKLDVKNSVLSVEVPEEGSIDFIVSYVTYVEEVVEGRGNLATRLVSSGLATSTYNEVNKGQLFHYGTENYLHFNAWSGYGNYIKLDSDYVKESFAQGYTNIKVKYYVSPFGGGWVKIGPRKYDGTTNASSYLTSREKEPWLSATYDSVDNLYEKIWELSPMEIASFNFDAGDQLWIGEMASGSGKTQIIFTHFEFVKPNKAYNLLSDPNLFNATKGIATMYDGCEQDNSVHPGCWVQHIDISAGATEKYGYTGKYINMKRQGWCDMGFYLDKTFVDGILASGQTKLNIVAARTKDSMNVSVYDFNAQTAELSQGVGATSTTTEDNGLVTFTFDLTGKTFTDNMFIYLGGDIDGAVYIYEISFGR